MFLTTTSKGKIWTRQTRIWLGAGVGAIDFAFAGDATAFLGVKGCGVVLEVGQQNFAVFGGVEDFGFAFVELTIG